MSATVVDIRLRKAQRDLLILMTHRLVGEPIAAHDLHCGKGGMVCTCGADQLNDQIRECLNTLKAGLLTGPRGV